MKKTYFCIDEDHIYYEGYYNPEKKWINWKIPYFTKEIADKIVDLTFDNDEFAVFYNVEDDEYFEILFRDGCYDKKNCELYKFPGEIFEIDNKPIVLYSLGARRWNWEAYSLEEIENKENNNLDDYTIIKIEEDKEKTL